MSALRPMKLPKIDVQSSEINVPADSIHVNRWDANGFPVYDGRTLEMRLSALEKQLTELNSELSRLTTAALPPKTDGAATKYFNEAVHIVLMYLSMVEYASQENLSIKLFSGMAGERLAILLAELRQEGLVDFLPHLFAYEITVTGR